MQISTLSAPGFKSALFKGLGRALQATHRHGRLIDEDAVVDSCLHNRAFDPQVDGSRANWIFEILQAADAVPRFHDIVVSALKRADSNSYAYDLDQLCDLALLYALQGSREARASLYGLFHARPDSTAPWLAEDQIISLDGLRGFLHMAKERGKECRLGNAEWDSDNLVSVAEDQLGVDQVGTALNDAANADPDLKAFWDGLQTYRRSIENSRSKGSSRIEKIRAIPVQQVLDRIRDSDLPHWGGTMFRHWGRYASEEDLEQIPDLMFAERDAGRLSGYLKIFARRPMPNFDERLIELARHGDEDVRYHALEALGENAHPAVRALALARLDEGDCDGGTIGLLKKNYRSGDHRRIERVLEPAEEAWENHHLAWQLIDVFTSNRDKNCLSSMRFAYEETPCSACRKKIVALLIDLDILPDAIRDECEFDSNPEIRGLVGTRT
jgi:hypothetical protein